MKNILLKIILFFKRLFGMRNTTQEKAEYLKSQADSFLRQLSGWLEGVNKGEHEWNSDYAKMKHKQYYYASVGKHEKDNEDIFHLDIANLELEIRQEINPIAECIKFKTYVKVVDPTFAEGIRFDEIENARVFIKISYDEDTRIFKNEKISKTDLPSSYLDTIIEYFKVDIAA